MALGKRARTVESYQDTSISSRVKRRAQISIVNDEGANLSSLEQHALPCRQHSTRIFTRDGAPKPSSVSPRVVGAQRVALSPRKANGQDCSPTDTLHKEEAEEDKENVQLPTPKTPRHRDALSKRVPITPRHRIGLIGKPSTPRTLRTPLSPKASPSPYECARRLFSRNADPGPLIGREEERNTMYTFVEKSITSKAGGCMYVSGPPGTGKSALVGEICRKYDSSTCVKSVYINCMSAKNSNDIYDKLGEDFLGSDLEDSPSQVVRLRKVLVPQKAEPNITYMVTLDEIDHLLILDPEILYTLFEWSLHRSSRLIVIGIANALDLTDRFLPRLKSRSLKPQLLPFLPYTASQIASVITTKLKSLMASVAEPTDFVPILHPAAIQLCSKKVASQTGDLRKAFDIVCRTTDLIEKETKQKNLRNLGNHNEPAHANGPSLLSEGQVNSVFETSAAGMTPFSAPRASIAHVSRVSAAALCNGTNQRLQCLNLQQKAALCSLIFFQKRSRRNASSMLDTPSKSNMAPSVGKLYGTYSSLCKQENALHPLTSTEFVDIIAGLETLGLIGEERLGRGFGPMSRTPGKKAKGMAEDRRIIAYADEEEIKGCLSGPGGGILLGLLHEDI